MKHISLPNIIVLILTLFFMALPTAQAAVFEIQRVASTDSLNLRAKPGARNAIVGRVPHNGRWIRTDGVRVPVSGSNWIRIKWRNQIGWANEYYIREMQLDRTPQQAVATPRPSLANPTPVARPNVAVAAPRPAPAPTPPVFTAAQLHKKGAWILECGHMSPFWRVLVHPGKALEVNLRGRNTGIIPMTYQKQDKNKWNTAMKTVVKGSNARLL